MTDEAAGGFTFKVVGIPVRVRPSFFVVSVLLGLAPNAVERTLIWIAVSFVCVLAHELGHALTARMFGRTARIELHGMGGTAFHGGRALSIWQDCVVLLAGPVAGFVLGALVWPFRDVMTGLPRTALDDVLWITWGYGVLNLVPIMPLDGGQIVATALGRRFGARGEIGATVVALVSGVGLIVAAVFFSAPRAVFLLLWLLVSRAKPMLESARALLDQRHRANLDAFNDAVRRKDFAMVASLGEPLLHQTRAAKNRAQVAHGMAFALGRLRRFDEGAAALAQMPAGWTADAMVRGRIAAGQGKLEEALPVLESAGDGQEAHTLLVDTLNRLRRHDEAIATALRGTQTHPRRHVVEGALYAAGRIEESLAVSEAVYAEHACAMAAYNACCSSCRLGRLDDGMKWLERAVDAKWRNRAHLEKDHDVDPLRDRPEFAALVARIAELSGATTNPALDAAAAGSPQHADGSRGSGQS